MAIKKVRDKTIDRCPKEPADLRKDQESSEYETDRVVQASDQALKDYLRYWIDNAKAGKLAARTLYEYREIVSLHFSDKVGKKALSHLRPLDIQDFYQTLSEY